MCFTNESNELIEHVLLFIIDVFLSKRIYSRFEDARFNLILDLVSFVRDSSSAIDFERLAGINFPKYSPARS